MGAGFRCIERLLQLSQFIGDVLQTPAVLSQKARGSPSSTHSRAGVRLKPESITQTKARLTQRAHGRGKLSLASHRSWNRQQIGTWNRRTGCPTLTCLHSVHAFTGRLLAIEPLPRYSCSVSDSRGARNACYIEETRPEAPRTEARIQSQCTCKFCELDRNLA